MGVHHVHHDDCAPLLLDHLSPKRLGLLIFARTSRISNDSQCE